jgi:hypothetical protein
MKKLIVAVGLCLAVSPALAEPTLEELEKTSQDIIVYYALGMAVPTVCPHATFNINDYPRFMKMGDDSVKWRDERSGVQERGTPMLTSRLRQYMKEMTDNPALCAQYEGMLNYRLSSYYRSE